MLNKEYYFKTETGPSNLSSQYQGGHKTWNNLESDNSDIKILEFE